MTGAVELTLGERRNLKLQVMVSPYLSICAMVTDCPGFIPRGLPARLADSISAAMGDAGHSALAPITHPGHGLAPDLLHPPFEHGQALTIEQSLDALRAGDDDRLLDQLRAEFGEDLPACCWGSVAEHPARWLGQLAGAIGRAGEAVADTIAWSTDRLNREADRIGAAFVRGGVDTILASLNPRLRVVGDVLQYQHAVPGRTELGDRPLVLAPILAGPRMMITNFDLPDAAYIAYSVYPFRRSAPGTDGLGELIGITAAKVLRHLERAHTVGELARALYLSLSATSEQCSRLEQLGLIHRERQGRAVSITRTERAEQLIELM